MRSFLLVLAWPGQYIYIYIICGLYIDKLRIQILNFLNGYIINVHIYNRPDIYSKFTLRFQIYSWLAHLYNCSSITLF